MYGRDPDQFWRLTLREIITIVDGDRQRIENDQALAYYQAYMSGLFSQMYDKGKFPKYSEHAPWQKQPKRSAQKTDQYDKNLERMMMMFTKVAGGKVH